MNPEMQVLQALDAVQDTLRRLPAAPEAERAQLAHVALEQLVAAPWARLGRPQEADAHGWLTQLRDVLRRIEERPFLELDELDALTSEGLWAASELERDLRRLVGAR